MALKDALWGGFCVRGRCSGFTRLFCALWRIVGRLNASWTIARRLCVRRKTVCIQILRVAEFIGPANRGKRNVTPGSSRPPNVNTVKCPSFKIFEWFL